MDVENSKLLQSRGIYILPNLLTTAGLFAGFYSIVAAMKGHFDVAAIAIFIAMIADGLDGRVARLTNTTSAFGAEYDSLSDMVSFGIAPALVVYSWALTHLGKLGWLAAFLYAAAGALRLARFNTQIGNADKRYFQGLAIPAAAGIIASVVWMGSLYHFKNGAVYTAVGMLTVIVAGLMVSSIRYHSFKGIDLKNRVPFFFIVVIVLILTAIAIDPPQILFGVFILYGLSGPVLTLRQIRKKRRLMRNS